MWEGEEAFGIQPGLVNALRTAGAYKGVKRLRVSRLSPWEAVKLVEDAVHTSTPVAEDEQEDKIPEPDQMLSGQNGSISSERSFHI